MHHGNKAFSPRLQRGASQINLNPQRLQQPNPIHAIGRALMEIGTIWIIIAALVILLAVSYTHLTLPTTPYV